MGTAWVAKQQTHIRVETVHAYYTIGILLLIILLFIPGTLVSFFLGNVKLLRRVKSQLFTESNGIEVKKDA